MKVIAVWDGDEAKIRFSKNYDRHSRITKLDFLQDVLHDLNKKYLEELGKFCGINVD